MEVWVREIPTMVEAFGRGSVIVCYGVIVAGCMISAAILWHGRRK